ncbi:unnamed protein product [Ilex paraguariensis]|uniref:Endonuclease/exonuclease/phosphatase domain-containing protein n=1 Tax=Ilex paraguariensis TaxID=185542 RepID=A0ABC8QRP2_9AQUA
MLRDIMNRLTVVSMTPLVPFVKRVNQIRAILDLNDDSQFPIPFMMHSVKILSWNCRRVGKERFQRAFEDILRAHKLEIVVLMETKVPSSQLGNFFSHLSLTMSEKVEPVGGASELWLMWDPTLVTISIHQSIAQVIHAHISRLDFDEWLFLVIYSSLNPSNRDHLWDNLSQVRDNYSHGWMAASDLNDFSSTLERRGRHIDHCNITRKFRERINKCELIDLGYNGPRLTWNNKRKGLTNTKIRLNKALANTQWTS